jgi:tetratricopeptide (TPR) repeat protein
MKDYLKAEALGAVRKGEVAIGIQRYLDYLAIEANAQDDDAWASLGGAYRRTGKIDQALESYRRAYELNPRSAYALVNLVSLHTARNTPADREQLGRDLPQAELLCRELITSGKATYWTWYDLATVLLIAGRIEEAHKTFLHAVALTPPAAKENFHSVLNNLRFLQEHNPDIPALADMVTLISQQLN